MVKKMVVSMMTGMKMKMKVNEAGSPYALQACECTQASKGRAPFAQVGLFSLLLHASEPAS